MKHIHHKIKRFVQTGQNCGPTALAQLFSFFGIHKDPKELVRKTDMIAGWGTYEVRLGITAMQYGFKASITTHNLHVFDPSWFALPKHKLIHNLRHSRKRLKNKLVRDHATSFIAFLENGGTISFAPISKELLLDRLQKHPILVGLCSTYLYREKRPIEKGVFSQAGHFVVITGYNAKTDAFSIVDPWYKIPFSKTGRYKVQADRLITAIYLGAATFDCSVLEIWK